MFVLYDKKSGAVVSYQTKDIFVKGDTGTLRLIVEREWPPVSPSPIGQEYIIDVANPGGNPLQKKVHSYIEMEFADGKKYKIDLDHPEDKPAPAKLAVI